jgi:hypothetical protein
MGSALRCAEFHLRLLDLAVERTFPHEQENLHQMALARNRSQSGSIASPLPVRLTSLDQIAPLDYTSTSTLQVGFKKHSSSTSRNDVIKG